MCAGTVCCKDKLMSIFQDMTCIRDNTLRPSCSGIVALRAWFVKNQCLKLVTAIHCEKISPPSFAVPQNQTSQNRFGQSLTATVAHSSVTATQNYSPY